MREATQSGVLDVRSVAFSATFGGISSVARVQKHPEGNGVDYLPGLEDWDDDDDVDADMALILGDRL